MKHLTMDNDSQWFAADLLERFGRYTRIHTTSDPHNPACPSSTGQWDLARVLETELKDLGLKDVWVSEQCYVMARLPATKGFEHVPSVGFLAHLDTSSDTSGKDVRLQVHTNWQGGVIHLNGGVSIDPEEYPALLPYKGKTILTSDGTTLLGADDKAGVAEIMTALRWMVTHPELPHGTIEVVFTPDEEIGRGIDQLPFDHLVSRVCYTLDGEDEGSYNDQCFAAWAATVRFTGVSMHPGYSRGRMVNAIAMATMFMGAVPRTESPEATDGDFGFWSAQEMKGGIESAEVRYIVRDFDMAQVHRRVDYLKTLAATVQAAFPGGKVEVEAREQYRNMKEKLLTRPSVIRRLRDAIRLTDMAPFAEAIRGGTDGSRLTERGILTPNIFAGGHNFHSSKEWVALESMERAAKTMINLSHLWTLNDDTYAGPGD